MIKFHQKFDLIPKLSLEELDIIEKYNSVV